MRIAFASGDRFPAMDPLSVAVGRQEAGNGGMSKRGMAMFACRGSSSTRFLHNSLHKTIVSISTLAKFYCPRVSVPPFPLQYADPSVSSSQTLSDNSQQSSLDFKMTFAPDPSAPARSAYHRALRGSHRGALPGSIAAVCSPHEV